MSRQAEILRGLFEQTLAGDAPGVRALTEEGLGLGMSPLDLLDDGLLPALQEVGRRFERREFFVPEMLVAAKAMQGALAILRPLLSQRRAEPMGTIVMATVRGDLHDIGKNLCNIMLEGAGFTVIDLGTNVTADAVVAAVEKHAPALVGLSAFLTTTMPMFKVTLDALDRAGLRDGVRVLIGGAPVTAEFAQQVGADGSAPDANAAVRLARRLVGRADHDGGPPAPQGVPHG
jgi:5-methyltetrahydrofolate--homocysteine methyltransferase